MKAVKRILMMSVIYLGMLAGLTSTANAAESTRKTNATATTVDTAARLAAAQQRGEQAIDQRLTSLSNLKTKINDAKYLSDSDRAALTKIVTDTTTGLTNLRAQIASDTTLDAIKPHLQSITHDYRVYVIVEPQVHLVRAADANAHATAKMQGVVTQLTNASAMLKKAAKDTSAIDADLAKATSALTLASKDEDGQASAALALKAQGWPGNSSDLKAIRLSLANAASQNASAATTLAKVKDEITKTGS